MKLTVWEKVLCILLPICTMLDPFFTYYYAHGNEHIITNEMNPLFVIAVSNDISPFIIFYITLFVIFMFSIITIKIMREQIMAYALWVSVMITLCILRPLAGLTWYVDTAEYTGLIITMFNICGIVMMIAIGLYVIDVLNQEGVQNNGTT